MCAGLSLVVMTIRFGFCLYVILCLKRKKNSGFNDKVRFQSKNSKQETMNFSGKDDLEYLRTNMKNNWAVSRWYVIYTFSATFFPTVLLPSSFLQIHTHCVLKSDSHIFFFSIYS